MIFVIIKNVIKLEFVINLFIFEIEDVDLLIKILKLLVKEYDILIYSMVVFDYIFVYMVDFEKVKLSDDLDIFLCKDNYEGKILFELEY